MRFHARLMRNLFFLWKPLFVSSATEKQHAAKSIDAKRKLMEYTMREFKQKGHTTRNTY